MKTKTRRGITLTLAYLAIALVMTEPLVFHFGGFSMAGHEDGSMSVWNLWWMKYSLIDLGQSPLFTDYLFYPDGVSLTFHSMPKIQGLIGIPLQYLAGLTVAYNIIFLLTFMLTAPGCGMGTMIADEARSKLLSIHGVDEVTVDLVWDPPWSREMISEPARLQMGLL